MSTKTKPRPKAVLPPPVPPTREEMEKAMQELDLLKAIEQNLASEKSAAYQIVDADFAEREATNAADQQKQYRIVEHWANTHPKEFVAVRSIALPHGTVGYRKGQPTVKPVSGRSFDPVIDFLLTTKRLQKRYIRVEYTLDKETVLKDRKRLKRLARIGVKVVQEDALFVKTTIENVSATVKGEAQ